MNTAVDNSWPDDEIYLHTVMFAFFYFTGNWNRFKISFLKTQMVSYVYVPSFNLKCIMVIQKVEHNWTVNTDY